MKRFSRSIRKHLVMKYLRFRLTPSMKKSRHARHIKRTETSQGILAGLPYVCIGIGSGLLGHSMGNVISERAIRNDPKKQKKLCIPPDIVKIVRSVPLFGTGLVQTKNQQQSLVNIFV